MGAFFLLYSTSLMVNYKMVALPLLPSQEVTLPPSPPLAKCALGQWGLFLGIGLALFKELVGVDIGFTPLSFGNPHRSLAIG